MDKRTNNQGEGRKSAEKVRGPHQKKTGAKNAPVVQNEQHVENNNGGNRGNFQSGGNRGGSRNGGNSGFEGKNGSSGHGNNHGKSGIGGVHVESGIGSNRGDFGYGGNGGNPGIKNKNFGARNRGESDNVANRGASRTGGDRGKPGNEKKNDNSGFGGERGVFGNGGAAQAPSDRKAVDIRHAQDVAGQEEGNRSRSDSFNSPRPTLPYHKDSIESKDAHKVTSAQGNGGQTPLMKNSKHPLQAKNAHLSTKQSEASYATGTSQNQRRGPQESGTGAGNSHQKQTSGSYRSQGEMSADNLRRIVVNIPEINRTIQKYESYQAPDTYQDPRMNPREQTREYQNFHQEGSSTAQHGANQLNDLNWNNNRFEDGSHSRNKRDQQSSPVCQRTNTFHSANKHVQEGRYEEQHRMPSRRSPGGQNGYGQPQGGSFQKNDSRQLYNKSSQHQQKNPISINSGQANSPRVEESRDDYKPYDPHNSVAPSSRRPLRSGYSSRRNSRSPINTNRGVQANSARVEENTDDYKPYDPHNSVAPSSRRLLQSGYSSRRNSQSPARSSRDQQGSSQVYHSRPLKTEDTYCHPPSNTRTPMAQRPSVKYPSWGDNSTREEASPINTNRGVQANSARVEESTDDYKPYDPHNSVAPSSRRPLRSGYSSRRNSQSPVRNNRDHQGSSQVHHRHPLKNDNTHSHPPSNPRTSASPRTSTKYPSGGDNSIQQESTPTVSELRENHLETNRMDALRRERDHFQNGFTMMRNMLEELLRVEGVRYTLRMANVEAFEELEHYMERYSQFP